MAEQLSKQPVSVSCFVVSLFVNLLEQQDITCCTKIAFTAAELLSQLQLDSRTSAVPSVQQLLQQEFGFPAAQRLTGAHMQAMLHTCCAANAAALSAIQL